MTKSRNKSKKIDLNPEFRYALDILENSRKSIFITGRAGTGKSTLLTYFREQTKKKVAVLAPTGVAALNVKGQTIHSFFKFKPGITPNRVKKSRSGNSNIYRNLDIIVIDEVSMVRSDLLDCVDRFLRLNGPHAKQPFGGIQMAFIGDLYQLPPVVSSGEKEVFQSLYETPYFYGANVFQSFDMEFVELEKIYRQHDEEFIKLLNGIRNNSITEEGLELLNSRYDPDFQPALDEFYIYLTTTNKLAEEINTNRLTALKGRLYTVTGVIEGDFGREYLPTNVDLNFKVGAQIMMLNNDVEGRWVNGSIGKITGVDDGTGSERIIIAELDSGEEVDIKPYTWEIYRFFVDENGLQSEAIGKFKQYPLMLAWAVTIHKGQGKTFEKVVIDVGGGIFAHGQMYVALSRCTTLEGIVLKKPALKKHIWKNFQVMDFLTKYQYKKAGEALPVDNKIEMIRKAIEDKGLLKIVYLKPSDEKSTRVIRPETIGEMEYTGKTYLGVRAFCLKRNDYRTFRVDRILEIEKA
jgi:ATP-dependent DNA helicase PIF1